MLPVDFPGMLCYILFTTCYLLCIIYYVFTIYLSRRFSGMLCIVAVLRECGTYLVMTVQMVGVMMPAWCPRFTSEEPIHSHTK